MTPPPIIAALESNALAVWLRTSLAYPVLESVHLIGLATLFGSVLIVDMRLLGMIRHIGVGALARGVLPWTWIGFLLAAGSGLCLFFCAGDGTHRQLRLSDKDVADHERGPQRGMATQSRPAGYVEQADAPPGRVFAVDLAGRHCVRPLDRLRLSTPVNGRAVPAPAGHVPRGGSSFY